MVTGDDFEFNTRVVAQAGPPEIPGDLGKMLDAPFSLFVSDTVINGVREYLAIDQLGELGGCLHGRRYETDGKTVVEIGGFTPLPSDDRGAAHFVFGAKAKEHMLRANRGRTDQIIGWFHSHPKMGDPFMSSDDKNVQTIEYGKPWQVAMVVAVGEWAMPIGFWRLVGDELVAIESYHVLMTTAGGESDRQYIRASFGRGEPAIATILRAWQVIARLPDDPCGPIVDLLKKILNGLDTLRPSADGVGMLRAAILLAENLASGSIAPALLRDLDSRLGRMAFLEDRSSQIFASEHVLESLVMLGDRSLMFRPESGQIALALFTSNVVLPLTLQAVILAAAAECNGGDAWLLLDGGLLFGLKLGTRNGGPLQRQMAATIQGLSEPIDLAVWDDQLLVRSGRRLIRLPTRETKEGKIIQEESIASTDFGDADWLLVHHFTSSPMAVLRCGMDVLELADAEGTVIACGRRAGALRHGKIRTAVATPAGLWLLVEQGTDQMLCMVRNDLSNVEREICVDAVSDPGPITCLAVDPEHRVFVGVPRSIRLISETGAPGRDWHRVRKLGLGDRNVKLWSTEPKNLT